MLIRMIGSNDMLEHIRLKNFVSHEDTSIPFSEGINIFIGKNGAGKSSVIDAITYAIYGKHERGNNTNIVRNNSNGGSVTLKFSNNGRSYEVYRTFNKNGSLEVAVIKENGRTIASGNKSRDRADAKIKIESILGLNYDDISIATIIKQGELDAIIDLKPREIRELINRLIELDKLDKAYLEFKDVLDNFRLRLKKEYGYDTNDLERIEKELDASIKREEDLRTQLKDIEERLKEEEEERKDIEAKIREHEELKRKYEQYSSKKEEFYRYLKRERNRYYDEYKTKLEIINQGYEFLNIIRDKDEIEKRYEELVELENASVKFNHLNNSLNILKSSKSKYEDEINKVKEKIKEHESKSEPEYDYRQIINMLNGIRVELDEINRSIGEIRTKLDDYEIIKSKGICPTCDRSISNASIDSKIHQKLEEMYKLENKMKEMKYREEELEVMKDARKRYDQAMEELIALSEKLERLETDYNDIIRQHEEIEEELIPLKNKRFDISIKEKERLEDKIKKIHQAEWWLKRYNIDANALKKIEDERDEIKKIIELLDDDNAKIEELAIDEYSRELIDEIKILEEESRGYNPKEYHNLIVMHNKIYEKIKELSNRQGGLEASLEEIHKKIEEFNYIKEVLRRAYKYIRFYEQIRDDIYHKRLPLELRGWAFDYISDKASEYLRIFDIGLSSMQLREEKNSIKMQCYGSSDLVDINSMSGGEKVAVSLALRFAIASFKGRENIDFIILDEPTTHLDQERRRALVKLIAKLAGYQGLIRQIIMITHDAEIFEDADIDNIVRFEKIGGISKVFIER